MRYRLKNEEEKNKVIRRIRVAVIDGRVSRRVFNKCYCDPNVLNFRNILADTRRFFKRRHNALTVAFAFAFLFFTVAMFGTMTKNKLALIEYKTSLENEKEKIESNVDTLSDKIDDILAVKDEKEQVIEEQKQEIETVQEELEGLMSRIESQEDEINQYKQDIKDLDEQKTNEVQNVADEKDAVIQQLIDIIEGYDIFDNVLTNEGDMEAASSQVAEVRKTMAETLEAIGGSDAVLEKLDEEAEKIQDYLLHYPNHMPTTGRLTSRFGWRKDPFTGSQSFHKGIDLCASSGTAVFAAASGKVSEAKYHSSYGYYILIDHGNGYETRYAHLSKILVSVGQTIEKGQQIGKMGSTGRATGPHLHFEVIYDGELCNPLDYVG